jgi:flagellar motor protein MotB
MKTFVEPRTGKKSGGEPWQVIYTDLMTIIMVFFVILWSLNQGKDVGVSETIGEVSTRLITLPGDVLFPAGRSELSMEGSDVFYKIFFDESGQVLNFDDNGLTKRLLVIHGHTDGDGEKDANFQLGFRRAFAAYSEIKSFTPEIEGHAIICSHADNSPLLQVPLFQGVISQAQREALNETKAQNRRITIEDTTMNQFDVE